MSNRVRQLLSLRPFSKKVFCISYQRTGTTSMGRFFHEHGFKWAGYPADLRNGWSQKWYEGDFEGIFRSLPFRVCNAFEDSPWWYPDFYKVLFHRFRGAKFILWSRDPKAWFRSMRSHSDGNILGHNRRHCRLYRRETEFYRLLEEGAFGEQTGNPSLQEKNLHPMKLGGEWEERYIELYKLHQVEVKDFFSRHDPAALHVGELEDPDKWTKLGNFLGIRVSPDYDSHQGKSDHGKTPS